MVIANELAFASSMAEDGSTFARFTLFLVWLIPCDVAKKILRWWLYVAIFDISSIWADDSSKRSPLERSSISPVKSRLKASSKAAYIRWIFEIPVQAQSETIKRSVVKFRVHLGTQAAVYNIFRLSFRREGAIGRYHVEKATGHRCVLRWVITGTIAAIKSTRKCSKAQWRVFVKPCHAWKIQRCNSHDRSELEVSDAVAEVGQLWEKCVKLKRRNCRLRPWYYRPHQISHRCWIRRWSL